MAIASDELFEALKTSPCPDGRSSIPSDPQTSTSAWQRSPPFRARNAAILWIRARKCQPVRASNLACRYSTSSTPKSHAWAQVCSWRNLSGPWGSGGQGRSSRPHRVQRLEAVEAWPLCNIGSLGAHGAPSPWPMIAALLSSFQSAAGVGQGLRNRQ